MVPSGRSATPVLSLTVVLLAAAALRFAGIGYGLPAVFNPDEVAIMNRALGFATGDLNPHNFLYPTLYFYVLFAWEAAFFVAGRLAGLFDSLAAFERSFFVDPSLIFLAGRALTALAGVATVAATWRLAGRLFGPVAGVTAAALLAVSPLAVLDAHYIKHDVPVTLLIVLAHLALVQLATDPAVRAGRRRWLTAGAIAGLAMSTHYYAIFAAVPIALLALGPMAAGDARRARAAGLGLAALAATVAFFAASPFLLAEPGTALRDIAANRAIVVDRATTSGGAFGSLGFYVGRLAGDAMGLVTFAAAMGGVAVAARNGWRVALLLVSFPLTFVLFIANTVPATRYLNPVLPFVAILAAAGIVWLGRQRMVGRLAAVTVAALALAQAASVSVRTDRFLRRDDTRALAQRWVEAHLPAGTSLALQPYSVVLRPSRAALVEALEANLGDASRASVKFERQLALDPYPEPSYRLIYLGAGGLDAEKIYVEPSALTPESGLEPLRRLGVAYVIFKRFASEDPAFAGLDRALAAEASRAALFSPCRADRAPDPWACVPPFIHNTDARLDPALERPGPVIEIWKLR